MDRKTMGQQHFFFDNENFNTMNTEKQASPIIELEDKLREIIATWGNRRLRYVRAGLERLQFPLNSQTFSWQDKKITYWISVIFYGAKCNRHNQHNIHIYRSDKALYWHRSLLHLEKRHQDASTSPNLISENELISLVTKELEAVICKHNHILQEEYSWNLCENVLRGIARNRNWSLGAGSFLHQYTGDIRISYDEVELRLRFAEDSVDAMNTIVSSHDDLVKQVITNHLPPSNNSQSKAYTLMARLKKESRVVTMLQEIATRC